MTFEELAKLHPKLYHVTAAGAWAHIKSLGLRPASELVELFDVPSVERDVLIARRRPHAVTLTHARHGQAVISDNGPLLEAKLGTCLDDGLTPSSWLRMLNERVFFWTDLERASRLCSAVRNRDAAKEILVVETAKLGKEYGDRMDIAPINTGSTLHKPARRGLATFAPLPSVDYRAWRKQRGQNDRIVEVVIRGAIPDIADYVLEVLEPCARG